MEFLVERVIAVLVAIAGPLLTIFNLPGNTILLLTGLGFAFYDEAMYFNGRLLSAMVLIYLFGEVWEFCVELFGIKRKDVSWWAVAIIAIGAFVGTIVGTAMFPILGSILGGVTGACTAAFVYEYLRTGRRSNACHLAMEAAKMHFLAVVGKLAAGLALAVLLIRQVYFYN